MDLPRSWAALLVDRGIDPAGAAATRFEGGESTEVWRIDAPARPGGAGAGGPAVTWVLRRHRPTSPADAARGSQELDCELAAASVLASGGFPTPAPLPSRSTGELRGDLEGVPTTVWSFIPGHHPASLEDGYGSATRYPGPDAARLVARMHLLLEGAELPGARSVDRIPWVSVTSFLASDLRRHPVFAPLLDPLAVIHERTRAAHVDPGDLPVGLVHNDVNPGNLLVDDDGAISALLDLGDSMQTLLAYELAPLIGNFAVDEDHHVDVAAARALIAAHDEVRSLSTEERHLLPDLLALHAAAETIGVVGGWVESEAEGTRLTDSFSARQFFDLVAAGADLL